MRYAVLVPVFCVVLAGPVFGQAITGTIFGNISDPSGGMVAGAAVRAVNTLTSETHSTSSNVQGAYLFPVLPAGRYRLEAEAQGFKKAVRDGLTVGVNQNARVDVALEIGSVTQEVRVVADAPLVDTREAQLGGTVDRGRVVDLPLNGRNVYSLVSILPGVTRVNTLTLGNNEGNFVSVNGSRMRQTNFLLDGGANNSFFRNGGNQAPNPDAVQEFRLITSNFDAEFGRLSGAVVNVVTRSGTNELHGTLFEFLRNNRLNARNFFQPTVSALHQNQFGATAGGPVIRNKTFVFGSYQGLRVRNAAFVNSAITPTEAQRRGDFSAFPAASRPVDPATASPFPGGLIPQARLDPVAQNILKLVPQPNTADGRVQASAAARTNEDQGLLKIDHQLAAAHKLYGSLFLIHGSGFDPFGGGTQIPQYGVINSDYRQRNVVVNEDWIATPALLNQARFSYSHSDFVTSSPIRTSWSDFGSKVTLGALPPRLPQIFVNGYWQMGTFGEGGVLQKSFGFSDTLRWMRGAHSLKAGGGFMRKRYIGDNNWLGAGQVRVHRRHHPELDGRFHAGPGRQFPPEQRRSRDQHACRLLEWLLPGRLEGEPAAHHEPGPPMGSGRTVYQRRERAANVPVRRAIESLSHRPARNAVLRRPGRSRSGHAHPLEEFRAAHRPRIRRFRQRQDGHSRGLRHFLRRHHQQHHLQPERTAVHHRRNDVQHAQPDRPMGERARRQPVPVQGGPGPSPLCVAGDGKLRGRESGSTLCPAVQPDHPAAARGTVGTSGGLRRATPPASSTSSATPMRPSSFPARPPPPM